MIPISDILIRSISGYVFMVPVFVLYFLWLKKLGRTQSFLHTAAVFVFGYYLFGLLTVTGIGFTSTMTFRPNISWTPFIGMITGPIDTILNIILFVPLGFFLPLLYKKAQVCRCSSTRAAPGAKIYRRFKRLARKRYPSPSGEGFFLCPLRCARTCIRPQNRVYWYYLNIWRKSDYARWIYQNRRRDTRPARCGLRI